jgi:hypothetical protein
MEPWFQMGVTIVCAVFASSGFWALIQKGRDKKDAKTRMLLGLGHDRIIFLCKAYIEQGYISVDDYENLHEYLFLPYVEMGGNGTAARLMKDVENLPTVPNKKPARKGGSHEEKKEEN